MTQFHDDIHLPLTIEKHLENYSKCDDKEGRYRALWNTWANNKSWLSRMLSLVCQSFQSFSIHDASHSEVVLHNIERILGEERISQLSATDAFVILHICYLHDIGMVISHAEREEIIASEAFYNMVRELGEGNDERFQSAVENLERTDYENERYDEEENRIHLYRDKLEVYYAIINLLATYRRREHGKKGADSLRDGIENNTALGIGFAMSEIPKRIFLTMADCAETHTMAHTESIMELPYRDGGYAYDYMHPRFDAVLLQLGDVLDMDNNRFHPLMRETAGNIPHLSEVHARKHASIRKLCVNNESIFIEADCGNQEELRLIREEYDMIYNILEVAGYYWADICPKEVSGCLPTLKEIRLLLNGKEIPKELVTARFVIPQEKAFHLLEGSNMYQGRFVFLRELLQNAIDATKAQYFIDCMMNRIDGKEIGNTQDYTLENLNNMNSVKKYPIILSFSILKRKKFTDEYEKVKTDDLNHLEGYEIGVLVKIKDYGIGIGKDDILALAQVAHGNQKKIRKKMPRWLQPTGEFGIGLQSVFTVTPRFYCETFLRNGEHYRIEFNSGVHGGYINTTPIPVFSDNILESGLYGTEFSIFLPYTQKLKHVECMCGWNGEDPFKKDYRKWTPLRHSQELISQMILWLDGQIGEALFPIKIKLEGPLDQKLMIAVGKSECNSLHRIVLTDDDKGNQQTDEAMLAWILKQDVQCESLDDKDDKDRFYLDIDAMRLYLWCEDAQAFARLGVRRFIDKASGQRKQEDDVRYMYTGGTKIYYKGIFLEKCYFENDAEIIEYIDIKQRLNRSCLNVARNSLTEEGERLLEEKIYPAVLETARKVTKFIGRNENYKVDLVGKIKENLKKMIDSWNSSESEMEAQKMGIKVQEYVVSVTWMSYFACVDFAREGQRNFCRDRYKKECRWQETLESVMHELENVRVPRPWGLPYLEIPIEGWWTLGGTTKIESLAYVISKKHRFAVLSQREAGTRSWKQNLLEIKDDFAILDKLRKAESEEDFAYNSAELETLFEDVLRRSRDKIDDKSGKRRNAYEHNYLIGWLIRNIPTQALLMDVSGDIRLNILGYDIPREIYVNNNTKMLIWDRMLKCYKERGIERFATIPFLDLKHLSIKEIPSSVLKVKRGYFSHMFRNSMLMPIKGSVLADIDKKCEFVKSYMDQVLTVYKVIFPEQSTYECRDVEFAMFYEKLQEKFDDNQKIFEIAQKSSQGKKQDLNDIYLDKIRKLDVYCKNQDRNSHKNVERLKQMLEQYFKESDTESGFDNFFESASDLYEAIYLLINNPDLLVNTYEMELFINENWKKSEQKKMIVNYILEHSVHKVSRDDIEYCCECLLSQIYSQRIEATIQNGIKKIDIREECGLIFFAVGKKYRLLKGGKK